jgi:serine/threonine protein kinase
MTIELARSLLGVGPDASLADVERSYQEKRQAAEQRIAAAPTDNLKAKYRQSLLEIEQAREFMMVALQPGSHLSNTQFADLPGAAPLYESAPGGPAAANAANLAQPGQVLINRYEIRRRIGTGGMGAVYLAFDRNRREDIAIKVLLPHLLAHPQARDRFFAEAKIASSLSHPNIVNVFDVQKDGQYDFLTMELLKGQTLRQMIVARKQARKPFTPADAVEMGEAIGMALGYAHKHTVHRDVKPENIWVDDDGHYKLMDFGIARLMSTSQFTQTSTSMGTAYYMAPEQLKGAKHVDGRADQYSLAVILYEMVSGDIPAGRIKPLHTLVKGVPRGMSQAIDQALEPQPEARFPTMEAFVRALAGRGRLVPEGTSKWLLGLLAVTALIGALVISWPQIQALLPNSAGIAEKKAQAIQAQGVIDSLIKRIEDKERDIDSRVRDAKSAVDRFDGMVRMARNQAEKTELEGRLREAQAEFALWNEVRTLGEQAVFLSQKLIDVRGNKALGETALREGNIEVAASSLLTAQRGTEELLSTADNLESTLKARNQFNARFDILLNLAKAESINLASYTAPLNPVIDQAETAMREARFNEAGGAYQRATAEVSKVARQMVDDLLATYTQKANAAVSSNRLKDAETLLARAKMLRDLKARL